jgi:cytochrome c-type biogenesis protein CcmH/NrfF
MMEDVMGQEGGMLWFIGVVGGTLILGCVLVYAVIRNRRATKDPALTRIQEEGTRRARQADNRDSPD